MVDAARSTRSSARCAVFSDLDAYFTMTIARWAPCSPLLAAGAAPRRPTAAALDAAEAVLRLGGRARPGDPEPRVHARARLQPLAPVNVYSTTAPGHVAAPARRPHGRADADGNLNGRRSCVAVQSRRASATFTLTAAETRQPGQHASRCRAQATALRVTLTPEAAPSRRKRIRFRGRGFTAQTPVYAHYVYQRQACARRCGSSAGPTAPAGRSRSQPASSSRSSARSRRAGRLQVDQQQQVQPSPDGVNVRAGHRRAEPGCSQRSRPRLARGCAERQLAVGGVHRDVVAGRELALEQAQRAAGRPGACWITRLSGRAPYVGS